MFHFKKQSAKTKWTVNVLHHSVYKLLLEGAMINFLTNASVGLLYDSFISQLFYKMSETSALDVPVSEF